MFLSDVLPSCYSQKVFYFNPLTDDISSIKHGEFNRSSLKFNSLRFHIYHLSCQTATMSDDGSWWKVDIFLAAISSVTPLQQAWWRQMFTTWFPHYLIWYRPFKAELNKQNSTLSCASHFLKTLHLPEMSNGIQNQLKVDRESLLLRIFTAHKNHLNCLTVTISL